MPTQKEKYKSSGMFGAIFSDSHFFFFLEYMIPSSTFSIQLLHLIVKCVIKRKIIHKRKNRAEKKNDPLISSKLLLPQALGASPALIF
jgi:Na+/H+ antiporter NhaD/arsenite permease-like protein